MLARQDSAKIEVIVIDDCSTDNSFEEARDYSLKNDIDLKIIRNEINVGPGLSRNKGIESATGEYVTFVDSDDYLVDDFFDNVDNYLDGDLDCLVFDYLYVSGDTKNRRSSSNFEINEGFIDNRLAFVAIRGATWGKIYKRKLLLDNNCLFLDLKRNEDMPFTKKALAVSDKIYYLRKNLYCYVNNSDSLMHTKGLLDPNNALIAFKYLEDNVDDSFKKEKEGVFILECLYSTALTNARFFNRRQWKEFVCEQISRYPNCIDNEYFNRYSKRIRLLVSMIVRKMFFAVKCAVWVKDILVK